MDEMTAFERQLSVELGQMAGPGRRIDGMAMVSAISTQSPEWRFQTMFSATKFVVAGAIVAMFGGILLAGMLSQPRADDGAPAASTSEPPRLVYVLDGDIYVAAEDGTDAVRIVESDADAECGDIVGNRGLVSPDGRHVAYRSEWDDDCPGKVFIADLDGQVGASVPGAGWDIAWSPDGTRFATWLSFGESIGVYGIDGSLQAELDGSSACCGDHDPRWAPDGTALLLPAGRGDSARPAVVRLPIDGGEPQVIPADDPGSHRSLSYSPDGSRAAFMVPGRDLPAGAAAEPARAQLVIIATDGEAPRHMVIELDSGEQVDAGWGRGPSWSPRGDRIAVVVDRYPARADSDPTRESAHLRIVDPMTGLAITAAGVEDGGSLQPIAFSADGERILMRRFHADGVSDLSSVNIDGSGSTIIVPGADHGEWVPPSRSGDVPTRP